MSSIFVGLLVFCLIFFILVTYKGEVQLSGFVSSVNQAEHAVDIAKIVNVVASVKNDMRVKGTMNPFYK